MNPDIVKWTYRVMVKRDYTPVRRDYRGKYIQYEDTRRYLSEGGFERYSIVWLLFNYGVIE